MSLFAVVVEEQKTFTLAVCWLGILSLGFLIQLAEMMECGGKSRSSLI